jgi:hypothetical protein
MPRVQFRRRSDANAPQRGGGGDREIRRKVSSPPGQESTARRLANVLNRPVFRIDELACVQAADIIRSYEPHTEGTPWARLSKGSQLTFKIAFVAICHQFNWDFLQTRLSHHLLCENEQELIRRLASARADDVSRWLAGYSKPRRIQAADRAELLRAVGRGLQETFGGDSVNLVERAGGKLGGPNGFLAQLDSLEPYRADPLRKKSNVLVQDLVRERIVTFEDEGTIRPAVDYHIMRLYLRTGRVVPTQQVVVEILKGKPRPRPRLVRLLREAVAEAMSTTARCAQLSIADVNYIEWQIGRAVCDRQQPSCTDQNGARRTIDRDVSALFDGPCPYIKFCQSARDPEWRRLAEPKFVSRFY